MHYLNAHYREQFHVVSLLNVTLGNVEQGLHPCFQLWMVSCNPENEECPFFVSISGSVSVSVRAQTDKDGLKPLSANSKKQTI
jgi:hypothetical protein